MPDCTSSLPAAGDEPLKLPIDVSAADVWFLSLGTSEVALRGESPQRGSMRGFSASGRMVKAFQNESGQGVRTW